VVKVELRYLYQLNTLLYETKFAGNSL